MHCDYNPHFIHLWKNRRMSKICQELFDYMHHTRYRVFNFIQPKNRLCRNSKRVAKQFAESNVFLANSFQ